jgi:hypothetical protein
MDSEFMAPSFLQSATAWIRQEMSFTVYKRICTGSMFSIQWEVYIYNWSPPIGARWIVYMYTTQVELCLQWNYYIHGIQVVLCMMCIVELLYIQYYLYIAISWIYAIVYIVYSWIKLVYINSNGFIVAHNAIGIIAVH